MSQGFDPFDPAEWGDKPGCSAFETALEMRGRGALATGAVPVLDAHLAACDDCRDHGARLGRVDASLFASAASPDARRLRAKLDDALKETRRTPQMLAGIGLVAGAAMFCLFGGRMAHHKWVLLPIPLVIASAGLGVYIRVLRLRRLLTEPDAVGAYRRWMEWNLKATRWLPWAVALNVPGLAFPLRANWHRYAAGNARAGVYVGLGLFAIVGWVVALIMSRRRAHRLSAELAEMH